MDTHMYIFTHIYIYYISISMYIARAEEVYLGGLFKSVQDDLFGYFRGAQLNTKLALLSSGA